MKLATEGKSESARVSAAVALLDRAWGRPMQTIEANFNPRPASEMSDAELAAIAAGGDRSAPPVDPSKLN